MQLAWRALILHQLPSPSLLLSVNACSQHRVCAAAGPLSTTHHAQLHSSASAAADAPSTSSGSTSALGFLKSKLYQSSFLSQLFPGGVATKGQEQQQQPETKESKSEAEKASEQIDKMAFMTLEGYADQCRVRCSQDTQGKRLRLPPVPMSHPDFNAFIDFTRIAYVRLKQHQEIISSMTPEQVRIAEEREHIVLRDDDFLSEVAKQSLLPATDSSGNSKVGMASSRGEYLPAEVRDCMKSWLEMRRHGRFMRHWVSVQGKDANATDQELAVGKKEYDAYEAIELHSKMLAKRDTTNCALSRNLGFLGKHTSCSLTSLPWMNCCGGKPFPVEVAKKMLLGRSFEEARHLVEVEMAERGSSVRTRQPFNHLYPQREGAPRQEEHMKVMRRGMRNALTAKFERRTQSP